mmetsp:Transcript_31164/g.61017  ORF Transcript_31164/g.61017 Transcript_31164/m.61017 type:complete len:90 (-) Transcript_31164:1519-1788(-)
MEPRKATRNPRTAMGNLLRKTTSMVVPAEPRATGAQVVARMATETKIVPPAAIMVRAAITGSQEAARIQEATEIAIPQAVLVVDLGTTT